MNKTILVVTAMAVLAITLYSSTIHATNKPKLTHTTSTAIGTNVNDSTGFVLIELFTSEGCSSCPPADNLINKLAAENRKNVYILSYHVDYWNRLGWKDKYSQPEYSTIQSNYANYFNKDGVYTPQIVVNGKSEFVGSDKVKLYNAIKTTVTSTYTSPIQLSATTNNNNVVVNYQVNTNMAGTLTIALVQLAATTQVTRGENDGSTLQHTNIVTAIKAVPVSNTAKEINFSLASIEKFTPSNYTIIAFVKNTKGEVTAVTESIIK